MAEIRRRIGAKEPIPNRYNGSGNLTTHTQKGLNQVEGRIITGANENVLVGSKVNIPYLNQIEQILSYGFKAIAIVRDPVYTIGSWNTHKAERINEAHVTDDDLDPRWKGFPFTTHDRIERQAQIWNHYATLIWNLRQRIKIYTYELLTSDTEWVVNDLCDFLDLKPLREVFRLETKNIGSRYPHIPEIRRAVLRIVDARRAIRPHGCDARSRGTHVSNAHLCLHDCPQ